MTMANVPIGSSGGVSPSAIGLFSTDTWRTCAVRFRSARVGAMSVNSYSGMSIVCTGSVDALAGLEPPRVGERR